MRIKLIGGKYDGVTLIVPDDTLRYHPEGTKEIAYESQGYRIGFDVVFKLIKTVEDEDQRGIDGTGIGPIGRKIIHDLHSRRVIGVCPECGETSYEGLIPFHKFSCTRRGAN